MKRALWFVLTASVFLIMLLYARQAHQGASAFSYLNYAFLYDVGTGARIQITADMVPYIGLVTLYSVGVLFVMDTALALQRNFVTFVMSRLPSRGALTIWNLRSILGSSINFTLVLLLTVVICLTVLFHTAAAIYSGQLWLFMMNLVLTFASIGHVAVYVNLRYGHFAAMVSGILLMVVVFSIVMAFNEFAVVTFSDLQGMALGFVLSGALYIATAAFLKFSLGNMDI